MNQSQNYLLINNQNSKGELENEQNGMIQKDGLLLSNNSYNPNSYSNSDSYLEAGLSEAVHHSNFEFTCSKQHNELLNGKENLTSFNNDGSISTGLIFQESSSSYQSNNYQAININQTNHIIQPPPKKLKAEAKKRAYSSSNRVDEANTSKYNNRNEKVKNEFKESKALKEEPISPKTLIPTLPIQSPQSPSKQKSIPTLIPIGNSNIIIQNESTIDRSFLDSKNNQNLTILNSNIDNKSICCSNFNQSSDCLALQANNETVTKEPKNTHSSPTSPLIKLMTSSSRDPTLTSSSISSPSLSPSPSSSSGAANKNSNSQLLNTRNSASPSITSNSPCTIATPICQSCSTVNMISSSINCLGNTNHNFDEQMH